MLESHLTAKRPNRHTKLGCILLFDFSYGAIIETNSPSGALKIIEHLITWLDIIALHLSHIDNYVSFSSFLGFFINHIHSIHKMHHLHTTIQSKHHSIPNFPKVAEFHPRFQHIPFLNFLFQLQQNHANFILKL